MANAPITSNCPKCGYTHDVCKCINIICTKCGCCRLICDACRYDTTSKFCIRCGRYTFYVCAACGQFDSEYGTPEVYFPRLEKKRLEDVRWELTREQREREQEYDRKIVDTFISAYDGSYDGSYDDSKCIIL